MHAVLVSRTSGSKFMKGISCCDIVLATVHLNLIQTVGYLSFLHGENWFFEKAFFCEYNKKNPKGSFLSVWWQIPHCYGIRQLNFKLKPPKIKVISIY